VDLTVLQGILQVNATLASTLGINPQGNDSNHLILSGSAADVNTLLASLAYTRTGPGDEGTDTLKVLVTGTDGTVTAASTTITINPVAELPSAAAPASLALSENANNVAVSGVSVGPLAEDSDDTVSATLKVLHGTLHVGSAPAGVTVTGNSTGTLVVSG